MNISYQILKPLDTKSIEQFMDKTVENTARVTLNMTAGNFPRRTGDLERTSYTFGVKGGNNVYMLGTGVRYGKYVWNMKDVRWTNPSTIPQWYLNVFKNHAESILNQAIRSSK